jgi:ABC-2 type transport system ATP-binding protein
MWRQIQSLKASGVTIVLTTHYIEEAQLMADTIGVINKGKLVLQEDKKTLMSKFGSNQMDFLIATDKTNSISKPKLLSDIIKKIKNKNNFDLRIDKNNTIIYKYTDNNNKLDELLVAFTNEKLHIKDIKVSIAKLEDIFIDLVKANNANEKNKTKNTKEITK